jgi:spermidine synthase
MLVVCAYFELDSLARPEGQLVHYQETRYGRIEIHQDREQFTFFGDGRPMFSTQNEAAAQEAVHFPLSQLQGNGKILLISAEGGMLKEVAKYKPAEVDFLELDPETTKVEFSFGLLERITGLNVIHQDGRTWLSRTDKIYDAIILSLPEPETYQVNRFYTDGFFELAKKHLTPNGIFSFTMQGYDNYLDEPQRQKISSLYNTVSRHFAHVILLPGQEIHFLCSAGEIEMDIPKLLSKKEVKAEYVTYYFHGNITPERLKYLDGLLDPTTPRNYDFMPHLMRIMFSQWFAKFDTSPIMFLLVIGLLLFTYLLRINLEEFTLFSTGFICMGSEILVIFVFQIFYGYIYSKIGIIVTVFLIGLFPGAWLGERLTRHGKRFLLMLDTFLIGVLVFFLAVLLLFAGRIEIWFLLFFGFLVSLACGCQFPIAFGLCGGDSKAAAHTFSADLIGAACGTLVTSIVLIPYIGIIWSTITLIGLKFVSLSLLSAGERR